MRSASLLAGWLPVTQSARAQAERFFANRHLNLAWPRYRGRFGDPLRWVGVPSREPR